MENFWCECACVFVYGVGGVFYTCVFGSFCGVLDFVDFIAGKGMYFFWDACYVVVVFVLVVIGEDEVLDFLGYVRVVVVLFFF